MRQCLDCNSPLDDYEIEICNACARDRIKPTELELDLLKGEMDTLEEDVKLEMGYDKISGGFVKAEMFDYDEDYIDIELKFGVQSDVENTVHTEQYKFNRITHSIEDV